MRDILERVREQGSTSTDELIRGLRRLGGHGPTRPRRARGARSRRAQLRPGRVRRRAPGAARRDACLGGRRRQARGRSARRTAPAPGATGRRGQRRDHHEGGRAALGDRNGLTVITNAVTIALEVSRSPRVKTILTGARSAPPRSRRSVPWPSRVRGVQGDDGVPRHGRHQRGRRRHHARRHRGADERRDGDARRPRGSGVRRARRSGARRWHGWPTSATCRSW